MKENKDNVISIGYEQTDEKVEIDIYGIRFEINKKILDKDTKNIGNGNPEEEIEDVLGNGAVEKINNKRVLDGHSKMTVDVAIKILSFIYARYIETTTDPLIDNIDGVIEKQKNRAQNMYGQNREQRRTYNRRKRRRY